jgi:hypothetical protein
MPKTRTLPEITTRYVRIIARLFRRLREPSSECRLGREPSRARRDRCSACTYRKATFEIDHAVARLIENNTFSKSIACPYRVFAKHLWLALMIGPEMLAAVHNHHQRTVDQLESALKHLRMALRAYEEHEWVMMFMEKEYHSMMKEVFAAQQSIAKAVDFFRTEYLKRDHPTRKSKRGRGKELARQTIVRGCSFAWEELTGLKPGKANTKFHDVLSAASATVFGARDRVTGWEWQIKIFEAELKKFEELRDKVTGEIKIFEAELKKLEELRDKVTDSEWQRQIKIFEAELKKFVELRKNILDIPRAE